MNPSSNSNARECLNALMEQPTSDGDTEEVIILTVMAQFLREMSDMFHMSQEHLASIDSSLKGIEMNMRMKP